MNARVILKNATAFLMAFVLLSGIGLYMAPRIPVDLFPSFNPPVLVVVSSYSGASPEVVEESVTKPLEATFTSIPGIRQISSVSSYETSMIILEFDWGGNLDEATNDTRDKLEFGKMMLPDEVETPAIYKFDPATMPIMSVGLLGERTPEELRVIAEDVVSNTLEQIDGVSQITLYGGREKMVRVEFNQNRLEAYNLSMTQIASTLGAQNQQFGGGVISDDTMNLSLRIIGEFSSLEDIANSVITYKPGSDPAAPLQPILLGDLADVFMGYGDSDSFVYINGEPGIYFEVQKQSGANSIETADLVYAALDDLKALLPDGVSLTVLSDDTTIIRTTVDQLVSSALIGLILAVLVLLLFLRNGRSALIISLSIPVSLLFTVMAMYFFGITINIMTMAGLILGLGMIVDSSIVVLENIFTYRSRGLKHTIAAIIGSQEMFVAIVASTLTTVCVFLPILIFETELEVMGIIFGDLAFTIVIALISSLLVALFLVPIMAGRFLPLKVRKTGELRFPPLRALDILLEGLMTKMENFYAFTIRCVIRHKGIFLFAVVAALAGSLFLATKINSSFMPSSGEDEMTINMELPMGTPLAETEAVLWRMRDIIRDETSGARQIVVTAGSSGSMFSFGAPPTYRGSVQFRLTPEAEGGSSADEIRAVIGSHEEAFIGTKITYSRGMTMGGSGAPVDISFKGDNPELVKRTADEAVELLKRSMPQLMEVATDLDDGEPRIEVLVDRRRANELGVNVSSIGREIAANVNGITAAVYNEEGNDYNIRLILKQEDRREVPDIDKIFVLNSRGAVVPVANIASYVRGVAPVAINREDQSRLIHVTAQLRGGAVSSIVDREVRELLAAELQLPEGVSMEMGGDMAELQRYIPIFIGILVIALALVYGTMAGLFDSLKDPFIIFLMVPFTAIGIILIYFITGSELNILTAVGLVMLCGIVVNNGIVLIDYTNLLVARGLSLREACVEGGRGRLRPVLISTLTTILGMSPMAFSQSSEVSMVQPIGLTVIGGLAVSTVLTLYLAPVLYEIFNKRKFRKIHKEEVFAAEDAEYGE